MYTDKDAPEFEEVPEDRETILNGFTSEWDLKLFRESQVTKALQLPYFIFVSRKPIYP